MYIFAAVGPAVKPVTCWSDDVSAFDRAASADNVAKVERSHILLFKNVQN